MNLLAWTNMCIIAKKCGRNYWNYKAYNGATIKAAIKFMFAAVEGRWKHGNVRRMRFEKCLGVFQLGYYVYKEKAFLDAINKIPLPKQQNSILSLAFPIID